jgi:hypothetical protein
MSNAEIWTTCPLGQAKRPRRSREHRLAADQAKPDAPPVSWSFEASPKNLRGLAQAPLAVADWIAKAREALRLGADG